MSMRIPPERMAEKVQAVEEDGEEVREVADNGEDDVRAGNNDVGVEKWVPRSRSG